MKKELEGAARGYVCAKHERWCANGVCDYCEQAAPAMPLPALTTTVGVGCVNCMAPATWMWSNTRHLATAAACQKHHEEWVTQGYLVGGNVATHIDAAPQETPT